MSKLESLELFLHHCESKKLRLIELHWTSGEKSGIGNPTALETLLGAIKDELKRQIEEEKRNNK